MVERVGERIFRGSYLKIQYAVPLVVQRLKDVVSVLADVGCRERITRLTIIIIPTGTRGFSRVRLPPWGKNCE